jgi:hypothetical protein
MSSHAELIPDELILAAIDRAARHRGRDGGVPRGLIYMHLAIPSRSGAARHAYRRLPVLEVAGLLIRSRRNGIEVWELTSAGRRRLRAARRADRVVLPESPQHRAWREARTLAGQEIGRFRRELDRGLTSAHRALRREPPVGSDTFFELAQQLRRECRRLGSAIYCLREWPEPDDARPDSYENLDPGEEHLPAIEQQRLRILRVGRRGIAPWDSAA